MPRTLRTAIVGAGAHDEIRGGQKEEVQDLVVDLGHDLHQFPEFVGRGRHLGPEAAVHRLVGGGVVHPGADAADAVDDAGHLFGRPALDEFFEAPQGHDVQPGVGHVALIVQLNGNAGMALDAGEGLDVDDPLFGAGSMGKGLVGVGVNAFLVP